MEALWGGRQLGLSWASLVLPACWLALGWPGRSVQRGLLRDPSHGGFPALVHLPMPPPTRGGHVAGVWGGCKPGLLPGAEGAHLGIMEQRVEQGQRQD